MADRKSPTKLPKVAVFIVSEGYTQYLSQTLKAVRDSSYPLTTLTIIDTSSKNSENSVKPEDLESYSPCRFLRIPNANYAKALQTARAKFPDSVEYLWILHDDSAPTITTLQALVQYCYNYPDTVVAGPKVFSWNNPESLLEVGIKATRYGERLENLESEEIDQGQYDHRRQVLAVSAAGMLVKAKVWDQLRGMNPVLSTYNDGLEFCRRVWLAGYQVAVVPKARIYHARTEYDGIATQIEVTHEDSPKTVERKQTKSRNEDPYLNQIQKLGQSASAKYPFKVSKLGIHSPLPLPIASFDYCGYDPADPDAPRPHQPVYHYDPIPVKPVPPVVYVKPKQSESAKIRSQYFLRALYQPRGIFVLWLLWQLLSVLFLGVFRVLMGRTQLALNHLSGVLNLFSNLRQILKARKQVRLSRKVSMTVLKPLEANRLDLLEQYRLRAKIAKDQHNQALKLESTALAQLQTIKRRCAISAGFLALGGLIFTIMMGYPYRNGIQGGYWAQVPENWGDLWQIISTHWIPGGMGTPGVADPLLPILTFLTAPLGLLGISVNLVIKLIFLLSPILIIFSAWSTSALVSRHHLVRVALSLTWLINPAFIFSYYSGNLSAIIGCITLPLALFGIFQYYGIGAKYQLRGVRKLSYYQPVLGRKIATGIATINLGVLFATAPWMVLPVVILLFGLAIYKSLVLHLKSPGKIIWQGIRGLILIIPAVILLLPSFLASLNLGKVAFYAYLWQSPNYRGNDGFLSLGKNILPSTVYGWVVICLCLVFLVLALFGTVSLANWPRQLPGLVLIVLGALAWILGESTPVGNVSGVVVYAWPATAVALLWLGLMAIAATFLHSLETQRIYFQVWPIFRGILVMVVLIAVPGMLVLGIKETPVLTDKTNLENSNPVAPNGFSIISQGSQRSRLIVLDRDKENNVYQVKLWRLPGPSLTDSNTAKRVADISDPAPKQFAKQLGRIPALLLAGDSEVAVKTVLSLGADEILLMENADPEKKISATLKTSARVFKVTENSGYSIWRLDASDLPEIFSPVRASWQEGSHNMALNSGFIRISEFVKPADTPRQIILHEAFNSNWYATLSGKTLKSVNLEGQQGFEWPAKESGYLQISYHSDYWWGWPYLMLVLFGVSLLGLIPWPEKKVV